MIGPPTMAAAPAFNGPTGLAAGARDDARPRGGAARGDCPAVKWDGCIAAGWSAGAAADGAVSRVHCSRCRDGTAPRRRKLTLVFGSAARAHCLLRSASRDRRCRGRSRAGSRASLSVSIQTLSRIMSIRRLSSGLPTILQNVADRGVRLRDGLVDVVVQLPIANQQAERPSLPLTLRVSWATCPSELFEIADALLERGDDRGAAIAQRAREALQVLEILIRRLERSLQRAHDGRERQRQGSATARGHL